MTDRQHVVNTPEGDLGPFVADVLELAGRFRRAADEIARREGETQARWHALSVFSGVPLTVSQAARRLGTSRQAVQRTANELLERGLAATRPNPDHRAAPLVVLTAEGRATLERISRAAEEWRRERFPDDAPPRLDAARAEVAALLDRLRDEGR